MRAVRRALAAPFVVAAALLVSVVSAAERDDIANGLLLVAKPELTDPNFRETVVLITQPRAGGGPMGVIINRPTEVLLRQAFQQIPALQSSEERVWAGGPVQREMVLFLFRSKSKPKASLHVLADVYLSANADLLGELLRSNTADAQLRVYSGYAGWAPGQLQSEIERGGWVLVRAEPEIIFSTDPTTVWRDLIGRAMKRKAGVNPVFQSSVLAAKVRH